MSTIDLICICSTPQFVGLKLNVPIIKVGLFIERLNSFVQIFCLMPPMAHSHTGIELVLLG